MKKNNHYCKNKCFLYLCNQNKTIILNFLFAIKHFFCAGYYKGHRVHSPNIYNFFEKAIFSKKQFDYSAAENANNALKKSKQKIQSLSIGAKGTGKITEKKVSDIAKKSSSCGRYGRLLQRISAFLQPSTIVELGTSLGIGTIYLASGCESAKIITVEGCSETLKIAKQNFIKFNKQNIETINANFNDVLEPILKQNTNTSLIFVDGNHTYDDTISYFSTICKYANDNLVVIFDDINWSKGMTKAWRKIQNTSQVVVSVETARMGIIFFNKALTKKNYCTRY